MKGLETGKDKIQKICDQLRKETLEPAKQEAREIVENAHMQASTIVEEAKAKAAEMIRVAEKEMEDKRRVFTASLSLASRQGIEQLKQKIEKELFSYALNALVTKEMNDPHLIAKLISHYILSNDDEGEVVVQVPHGVSPRAINELLATKVLDRLKNQSVVVSDFSGGVKVVLSGRQVTVDMTDSALRDMIAKYIRKDLRDLIFNV